MPTGYTARIAEGQTFEEFASTCARAFGALVTMRDEPMSAELPDEVPGDRGYAEGRARAAAAALAEFDARTDEQHAADMARDRALLDESAERVRADKRRQRAAYEAMLARVGAWHPPTPEHVGLKTFMHEQIAESIRFDCSEDYVTGAGPEVPLSEWVASQRDRLVREVTRCHEHASEEAKRTAERNAWIKALKESLR
jgi:hypothetical protein